MNQEKLIVLENLIKKEYGNTTGIAVLQYNHLLYENYFQGCTSNSRVHIYSVTKSILSILIGIAIDKGYIKSIQERILDYFPEIKREKDDSIQNITIKDLLTMSAPYQFEEEPYEAYFTSDSYVKTALGYLGGKGRIKEFRYTPIIGPDILSGILVRSTNRSVFEFAREYLFTPLEIQVEKNIVFHNAQEQFAFNQATDISGWVMDEKGVNTAGWGLSLSVMDMTKIGSLYLNQGKWNDIQIVSQKWIHESTAEHSRWKELNLAYGYLWWVFEDGFAAMGDGGNVIYVNTKINMVISIASLLVSDAKDRMELIQKHIIPIFEK